MTVWIILAFIGGCTFGVVCMCLFQIIPADEPEDHPQDNLSEGANPCLPKP
jgi:hypothetical protein